MIVVLSARKSAACLLVIGTRSKMKNDLFDLSGDVAVVTGGTGTLGGAMADALAAYGAKVAILGRNPERGAAP